MTISDQASDDVDKAIHGAAMASMLNLRDVFELIHDALDNRSFAQEEFIHQRQQAIFHVLS